jgi:hypothetical protein
MIHLGDVTMYTNNLLKDTQQNCEDETGSLILEMFNGECMVLGKEWFRFLIASLACLCITNDKLSKAFLILYFGLIYYYGLVIICTLLLYTRLLIPLIGAYLALGVFIFYNLWKRGHELLRIGLVMCGIGLFVRCVSVVLGDLRFEEIIEALMRMRRSMVFCIFIYRIL